jgi:hypothetical protein
MKVAVFEDVVFSIRLKIPSKLMKTLNQNYLSGVVGKARANKSGSVSFLINKTTNELRGLSPQTNYTSRATAACLRS